MTLSPTADSLTPDSLALDSLTLALIQFNPKLGDLTGNAALIREARARWTGKAGLLVLPELALSGYPPEDLVLRPGFLADCRRVLDDLAADTADGGPALLVGVPLLVEGKPANCVALLDGGAVASLRIKHDLPNYGVFDEKRVFRAGPMGGPIPFRGFRLGVMICEDMWSPDATETLIESGAEVLIVPNGSPFEEGKRDERLAHAVARVVESGLPLVYVNQVGGQDELVFDGASFALAADCRPVLRLPGFQPAEAALTLHRSGEQLVPMAPAAPTAAPTALAAEPQREEELYAAMLLGLRDYVGKNGFPGVVLGLSGGVDSALAAALAVDALGADRVWCVMLPSPYTSTESLEDAAAVARLLGVRLDSISIEPAMAAFGTMLAPVFADRAPGRTPGITEENLQSRARGVTLMGLSNTFGHMVLSTGNKSEMAVGYATLYGDMCGGYAVLKDLYKTDVFAVCRWRNKTKPAIGLGPQGPVMPQRVIDKPPSAELRPNQTDQDSLPPYDLLDAILRGLIEGQRSSADLIAGGFDAATVQRVWRLVDGAEYKRRQSAPGPKLTRRAFGKERRYPITNGYRG